MEWISVKDRLPPDGVYLVSDSDDILICGYYSYDNSWMDLETSIEFNPTHWMILPEPPKDKE